MIFKAKDIEETIIDVGSIARISKSDYTVYSNPHRYAINYSLKGASKGQLEQELQYGTRKEDRDSDHEKLGILMGLEKEEA